MYNSKENLVLLMAMCSMDGLYDPEKCKQYTDKEIRREHNVLKMFKAGAFKLKGE